MEYLSYHARRGKLSAVNSSPASLVSYILCKINSIVLLIPINQEAEHET